jgi:predicted transcriptional regulator
MQVKLDLKLVDRETALKCWLTYHRISYSDLASEFDVDPSFISHIVKGQRKSRRIIDEMIRKGVPAGLLNTESDMAG